MSFTIGHSFNELSLKAEEMPFLSFYDKMPKPANLNFKKRITNDYISHFYIPYCSLNDIFFLGKCDFSLFIIILQTNSEEILKVLKKNYYLLFITFFVFVLFFSTYFLQKKKKSFDLSE